MGKKRGRLKGSADADRIQDESDDPFDEMQRLMREIPSHAETVALLNQIADGGTSPAADRAIVLVGGALLEASLMLAINHLLKDRNGNERLSPESKKQMFEAGNNGPASDFYRRIILAYALDLIGKKARTDLDRIRMIRNFFAHGALDLSFDTAVVSSAISTLQIVKRIDGETTRAYFIRIVAEISERLRIETVPHIVSFSMRGDLVIYTNYYRNLLPEP